MREDLKRIVERDVDIVVKRALRNSYFCESTQAHKETIYVADRSVRLDRIARRGVADLPPGRRGVGAATNVAVILIVGASAASDCAYAPERVWPALVRGRS